MPLATGGCDDHGKLTHSSVLRQTYSHLITESGFSYRTAQRTSATCSAQKSVTSFKVAPVSATSSATSTLAPAMSTASRSGGSMTGKSRRWSTPV